MFWMLPSFFEVGLLAGFREWGKFLSVALYLFKVLLVRIENDFLNQDNEERRRVHNLHPQSMR